MLPDRYESIDDGPLVETRVRASRFLAQALRCDDETALSTRLEALRKRHHDATHHCWALRLGPEGSGGERQDDDGEPGGTAGAPILAELRRAGLADLGCVVVRWFGGVKLGTGGLVRAYGEAARAALAAAPRREVWRLAELRLQCDYEVLGAVEAQLQRLGPEIHQADRQFGDRVLLRLSVPASRAAAIAAGMVEATAGRIRLDP